MNAFRSLSLVVLSVVGVAACAKQGEGERCDRLYGGDSDCEDNLVCVSYEYLKGDADRCCPSEGESYKDSRCKRFTDMVPGTTGTGGSAGATSNAGTAGDGHVAGPAGTAGTSGTTDSGGAGGAGGAGGVDVAPECQYTSECVAPLVCGPAGVCQAECVEDRDCVAPRVCDARTRSCVEPQE